MNEKITVIVPIYNLELYLKKCIDSIVKQTYKNLQIILINDGSTDKSLEILKDYEKKDSRIIVIDKENSGVSEARNTALKMATGKYLTFVDADDWLEYDAIENLYNSIKANKEYSIVRGRYFWEYSNGKIKQSKERINVSRNHDLNIKQLIDGVLSGDLYCYMWLLLIKTDIIKDKIFFNTSLHMMEDTLFYLDLLLDGNDILFCDKITYHYYYNVKSASRNIKNCIRNYKNALVIHKMFEERLNKKNLNSKLRKEIYCTKTSKSIAETINLLYKYDKVKMKEIYKEITNSHDIMQILSLADIKKINKQNSIIIVLLRKKQYKILKLFLALRKVLARAKTVITKRNL